MIVPRRYARLSRLPRTLLFDVFPILLFFWSIVEVLCIRCALQASDAAAKASAETAAKGEKIFISSIHLHDEQLLRGHWNDALLSVVEALGPENVYVSIYESNSLDNTKGALRELDAALGKVGPEGVRRSIVLDDSTRAQELEGDKDGADWITTPKGDKERRRVPYLARLRNLTLKPLGDLEENGERFDKVLFLNDVVFTPRDVLALLNTNGGHYAAACAFDFKHAPLFYDTFALRDSDGHTPDPSFPFFRSTESRHALTSGASAIPVSSCWNGLVVMEGTPFYTKLAPLRFRALQGTLATEHVEASECCLIHADNPYSHAHGVFVNPAVRVGYDREAYDAVNPGEGRPWVSAWNIFYGIWESRVMWLLQWNVGQKEMVVQQRIKAWEKRSKTAERGMFCAVDEMQVLRIDGWAHV